TYRVQFLVFDAYMPGPPFGLRLKSAAAQARVWGSGTRNAACSAIDHALIKDAAGLAAYEQRCLAEGYEGIMVRDPAGLYKQGRSTVAEGGLLKVKQFLDAEATIIGFEEQMHNDNPRRAAAHGRARRVQGPQQRRHGVRCRQRLHAQGARRVLGASAPARRQADPLSVLPDRHQRTAPVPGLRRVPRSQGRLIS